MYSTEIPLNAVAIKEVNSTAILLFLFKILQRDTHRITSTDCFIAIFCKKFALECSRHR